jgi:hypothetical protein
MSKMMTSYIRNYGPINGPRVMSSKNRVALGRRRASRLSVIGSP